MRTLDVVWLLLAGALVGFAVARTPWRRVRERLQRLLPWQRVKLFLVGLIVAGCIVSFIAATYWVDSSSNRALLRGSIWISPDEKRLEIDMHDGTKLVAECWDVQIIKEKK